MADEKQSAPQILPLLPQVLFRIREQAQGGRQREALSATGAKVRLTNVQNSKSTRHDAQLAGLKDIDGVPLFQGQVLDKIPITTRYEQYSVAITHPDVQHNQLTLETFDHQPVFQDTLYLFNVLVALEWTPSSTTLNQLVEAFQAASNFLFDATDGYMAFGQVVFGGPELMAAADIQVMASNRFLARSWLNALNATDKYMPIRVGRGVWHKNSSVVIGWNEPEGFRTIIHEWGHYALNLLDEYIEDGQFFARIKRFPNRVLDKEQAKQYGVRIPDASLIALSKTPARYPKLVVPKLNLVSESIMASLEGTSEIVPLQRRGDKKFKRELQARLAEYPGVDITGDYNPGPSRVPIQLPCFYRTDALAATEPEEYLVDVDAIDLEHCWVYALRWNQNRTTLEQAIAQGSIDQRARTRTEYTSTGPISIQGTGFALYGVRETDELVFIGTNPTTQLPRLRRGTLGPINDSGKRSLTLYADTTTPEQIPVVTVIPETPGKNRFNEENSATITKVQVYISTDSPPDQVWICPIGQNDADRRSFPLQALDTYTWSHNGTRYFEVPHLDGQVVLLWRGETPDLDKLLICDYSQGGGPNSHVTKPEPPISAGSSEGNAMIFFARMDKEDTSNLDYSNIRIVTTRNYGGFEHALNEEQPRSYLFSIAASEPVPVEELTPTLVLYFDRNTLETERELAICRYSKEGAEWLPVPTYLPSGLFYAAIPLEKQGDQLPLTQEEYYRLFVL